MFENVLKSLQEENSGILACASVFYPADISHAGFKKLLQEKSFSVRRRKEKFSRRAGETDPGYSAAAGLQKLAILCFFFDEIAREFRHIRYLRRKKKERKRALREAKRRTPA